MDEKCSFAELIVRTIILMVAGERKMEVSQPRVKRKCFHAASRSCWNISHAPVQSL